MKKDKTNRIKKGIKNAFQSAADSATKVTKTVVETSKNIAITALDQDGDGKFDQEDVKIITNRATDAGKSLLNKSGQMIAEASKSGMAKDAAAGAAVGAVVAIPVPIVGPAAGAAVGAGIGVYKNLTGKGSQPSLGVKSERAAKIDVYGEILKLGDLKDKGLITTEEYDEQKKLLLDTVKNQA